MQGHKRSLRFKKTEIISSIFSNHNTMRLEINNKKNDCKKHKHVEVKVLYTEKYKTLMKEVEEVTNKWKRYSMITN